MARRVPKDLDWTDVVLEVEDPWCGECGRRKHFLVGRGNRIINRMLIT